MSSKERSEPQWVAPSSAQVEVRVVTLIFFNLTDLISEITKT